MSGRGQEKKMTKRQANEQLKQIEEAVASMLNGIDQNMLKSPHMRDTPARVARMFRNELFAGMFDSLGKMTVFTAAQQSWEPLFVGPITLQSTCAHHLMPIVGRCWIGCLPHQKRIPGLSKYARIVRWAMRRPSMQEELTQLIIQTIAQQFDPLWAGVIIEASHMCMSHRGVEEHDSNMRTSAYYAQPLNLRQLPRDDFRNKLERYADSGPRTLP